MHLKARTHRNAMREIHLEAIRSVTIQHEPDGLAKAALEHWIGGIDGQHVPGGVADALIVRPSLPVPRLQPEENVLASLVPASDKPGQIRPLIRIALVPAVG